MKRSDALEDKLKVVRYAKAVSEVPSRLRTLSLWPGEAKVKDRDDTQSELQLYLRALQAFSSSKICWDGRDHLAIQGYLEAVARLIGSLRATWFMGTADEVVGVDVPAAKVLTKAVSAEVTFQRDLMLSADQAASGICVELNHGLTGDEFEAVSWGRFAP